MFELDQEQIRTLRGCLTAENLLSFRWIKQYSHDPEAIIQFYAPSAPEERYLYVRTHPDSKVLAVAHTDVAHVGPRPPKLSFGGRYVKCPQLDDRLGCWTILHYLMERIPRDKPYDILLTDFEESGRCTARHFCPPEGKKYNWMFEFDRRGTDLVMYEYETKALKELVEEQGFQVGRGSFTDIVMLSHLGCAGFNVGTGYHREHSTECHADMVDLFEQVEKFLGFYHTWYDTHLEGNNSAAAKKKEQRTNRTQWYGNRSTNGTTSGDQRKTDSGTTAGSTGTKGVIGYHNTPHTGLGISQITTHEDARSPSKNSLKRVKKILKIQLPGLGDNEATRKIIDALKSPPKRRILKEILDKSVIEMSDDEMELYEEFIVPLKYKNGKNTLDNNGDGLDEIFVSDEFTDKVKALREQLSRHAITDKQFEAEMDRMVKDAQDQWDNQTEDTGAPFDADWEYDPKDPEIGLDADEYDRQWYQWTLDPDALDSGITFKEWYKTKMIGMETKLITHKKESSYPGYDYDESDDYYKREHVDSLTGKIITTSEDDTELEEDKSGTLDELPEPSNEELMEIEEIQKEIMQDPLYSSEEFPGGIHSQAQFLQRSRGLT